MGPVGIQTRPSARPLRVPRPLPAAAPLAVAGVALVVLAAVGVLPGAAVAFVATVGLLALAALRGLLAARDRWALRCTADELLRTGVNVHPQSALLVWRASELTSARNRRVLARSLRGIVRELERPAQISAVPLNRRGARPYLDWIRCLAERLATFERPVTAQGMVLVEELLTDGLTSPLYIGGCVQDLPAHVDRCLAALDGDEATDHAVRTAAADAPGSRRRLEERLRRELGRGS